MRIWKAAGKFEIRILLCFTKIKYLDKRKGIWFLTEKLAVGGIKVLVKSVPIGLDYQGSGTNLGALVTASLVYKVSCQESLRFVTGQIGE